MIIVKTLSKSEVINICLYGVYKKVPVINDEQFNSTVMVDACISEEIKMLNEEGVITLGCCCGHGKAGQIVEWGNAYGEWKGHADPPITLIKEESVKLARLLGYQPYPYYYADGENNGVWQMQLYSGCITKLDCENWHIKNGLPLEKHIGVI